MPEIYSLGHSNRGRDEFLQILFGWEIETLVDVRRYPDSSRFPHFHADSLETYLGEQGVNYLQLGTELGGYVEEQDLSVDPDMMRGWEQEGFKQYAAYTETEAFRQGLLKLEEKAREQPTAFMCAEGWFRHCHRQLIADQLKARGWTVKHIQSPTRAEAHTYQNVVEEREEKALYRERDEE